MNRIKRNLVSATVVALVACLALPALAQNPKVDNLCAGQTQNVGTVTISSNSDTVFVTYTITAPGAFITETHAHVASKLNLIPQTKGKSANPIPGQFAQKADHSPGVTTFTHVFPRPAGSPLYVAAHAVVEQFEGFGGQIVDQADPAITVSPGINASGNPADAIRFDFVEPAFYSLGRGGEFIAQYNCALTEIAGVADLAIWENSPAVPPIETALISVSSDGVNWTDVGSAGNTIPPATIIGEPDEFGTWFELSGISGARFVRVRDTSPPDPSGNGFDLEAIKSNQACSPTSIGEETAWGGACSGGTGIRFNSKGNWGTYIVFNP